jgi:catechol 2,3-dioxygenase-like lactoylglutathione lyase family enzyme
LFDAQITFCYTPDLEATARFYEQTLGLELALDQGRCSGDGTPSPEGVILTLVTTDVDDWYRKLCDAKVAFEKPPTLNTDFQIYHCFFRDPNGYLLEIQRFEDPAWDAGHESSVT